MTIKLGDLMPDLAARIAADEAHRQSCQDRFCDRCGRRPTEPRPPSKTFLAAAVARVLDWIPPAYAGAELDAQWLVALVGPETIARACEAVTVPSVAFVGPPGSGKTSLAASMYRHVARSETSIERLHAFRWVSAHQLAKARAGHPLGAGESPLVESCTRAPLLVLDELGGEDPRYASAVAEVLYERHAQQATTWVTTGVGPKEIAARYGGGIARRVFEGAAVFRLARRP